MRITVYNRQKSLGISTIPVKGIITGLLEGERSPRASAFSQISVSFVTDKEIRELNRRFHHTDGATDVLAFDLGREDGRAGASDKAGRWAKARAGSSDKAGRVADIVVSADTAIRNSRLLNTTPRFESCLYVIHGMLHLLGYDDSTPARRRLMRKKENGYVKLWL